MTTLRILPGPCGMEATITAEGDMDQVVLRVESACPSLQKLVAEGDLSVDPMEQMGWDSPLWTTFRNILPHADCPVPCALLRAAAVQAGLALPKDVEIRFA